MKTSCLVLLVLSLSVSTAEEIVLGWSGPLTGNSAIVGSDSVPAVQLAIDEVNQEGGIYGRKVRLAVEDDGYVVKNAISAYKKLVHQSKASIIFANTYGGIFTTAADAVRDQVLVIDPLDCNEALANLPENTLCLATKTETIAAGFVKHISESGHKTVLLLVEENDGWVQLIAENASKSLKERGVKILLENYPAEANSYNSSLIKAKGLGATAMIVLGNDQMGIALKEARNLGLEFSIYGIGSVLSPGFQNLAGSVEGVYVSSWRAPNSEAYKVFIEKFRKANQRVPILELASVPSYDAAKLILHCLKAKSDPLKIATSIEVRDCLLEIRNFSGVSGKISFDQDGAVRSIHESIFRVEKGALQPQI